jgi:plasmid stabilization system protein ParE
MKPVIFHADAEEELRRAAESYESRSEGLGIRFLDDVEQGLAAIAESPLRWPVLSGQIRRYILRPFPYGLLYRELPHQVLVLAVMHLHREPGYWKSRL